jgi:hypothetical protein
MKKILLYLFSIGVSTIAYSQNISFSDATAETGGIRKKGLLASDKKNKDPKLEVRKKTDSTVIANAQQAIADTFAAFNKARLAIIEDNTISNKEAAINVLINKRDSVNRIENKKIKAIKYWRKYDQYEDYANKYFNTFPAYYSSQAIRFFEDDTTHLKFFANNNINYNPVSRKMALYTEAINDYFGPFRLGIGFQIRSEGKVDTTKGADTANLINKKQDLLTALQNGGGDISLNLKYPFIKQLNAGSLFHYKIYLYANTGFSLPILNKATTDFYLNYDLGMEGVLYAKGFNNKITFYNQTKTAYFFGNRNYRKIITDLNADDPTSFFMLQSSFGLDFMDGYRLKVDLFVGNKFVRTNFPATITFTVRPGKGK